MSLEDLGRRAVACKHFYWMPGMSLSNGRTIGTWKDGEVCGSSDTSPPYDGAVYPMLDDPATIGCLLHLVQEAWNACRISVCFSAYMPDATKRWSVPISFFKDQRDLVHVPSFYGETQAEALVAALEAAP